MRWRRSYPESREVMQLRPIVIADQGLPQGCPVICGSRTDASEVEMKKNLHRCQNLERSFRCMYWHPVTNSLFYWSNSDVVTNYWHYR